MDSSELHLATLFGARRQHFISRRSSAHGVNSAKKKQQGCCANQPAILRRMIGAYYTTEGAFKSTLILNNKGPNQIVVTPILHGQNGQTFTASPIAVGGQSSSEVDLNLLASIAGSQFRSGSFEFTYEGRLLEIGGGLRIVAVIVVSAIQSSGKENVGKENNKSSIFLSCIFLSAGRNDDHGRRGY